MDNACIALLACSALLGEPIANGWTTNIAAESKLYLMFITAENNMYLYYPGYA